MRSRLYENALRNDVVDDCPVTARAVEYAQQAIEEMASEVMRDCGSGTIGIEIPVKNGVLGRVKRLQILFQD